MKWCCQGFHAHFYQVEEPGFGILVSPDYEEKPCFALVFKAVEKDTKFPILDFKVILESEAKINFCPWCGRNLARYYRKEILNLYRPDIKSIDEKSRGV